MYAVYHGPEGLTRDRARIVHKTAVLARRLARGSGSRRAMQASSTPSRSRSAAGRPRSSPRAEAERINLRIIRHDAATAALGISLDETTTAGDGRGGLARLRRRPRVRRASRARSAAGCRRTLRARTAFLTHPVFHLYRSETELLRYMRRLSDRDLALDRTHDPARLLHDEAQRDGRDDAGHLAGVRRSASVRAGRAGAGLSRDDRRARAWLCEITGYDAVSLQPNSGAQGEYAGLLAIRDYHRSRGETHRNVCLIPTSAHGTNPASAQMAGMEVVVVACDERRQHRRRRSSRQGRAACGGSSPRIMITYPSTHGVFEDSHRARSASIVHRHGGQVYLDGANMNAQVGLCAARRLSAPTSATSTCTRRSASRMAAAGPAWDRSASRRIWRRSCRAIPRSRRRRAVGPVVGRALRLGLDPADLLDLHPDDGRRRASRTRPRPRSSPPTTSRARLDPHFPGALQEPQWPRRA